MQQLLGTSPYRGTGAQSPDVELDIKRSILATCVSSETWFHSAVPDLLTNLNKLICFHMMRIVGSCRKILTEIHLNAQRLSFICFVGSSIAFGAHLRTLQFSFVGPSIPT